MVSSFQSVLSADTLYLVTGLMYMSRQHQKRVIYMSERL